MGWHWRKIPTEEERKRFLAAAASKGSVAAAARASGVTYNIGARWLKKDPALKAEFDAAKASAVHTFKKGFLGRAASDDARGYIRIPGYVKKSPELTKLALAGAGATGTREGAAKAAGVHATTLDRWAKDRLFGLELKVAFLEHKIEHPQKRFYGNRRREAVEEQAAVDKWWADAEAGLDVSWDDLVMLRNR